jgi:uncharacterized membrane protein
MTKFFDYFFKGLLVGAPLFVTIMVAAWVFKWLYGYAELFLGSYVPPFWMKIILTVGVLMVMLAIITLLGLLASNILGQRAIRWLEGYLEKLPGLKMIYTSVKDITQAFGGEKKKFDKPVLIRPAPGGVQMMGFVTCDALEFIGGSGKVSVYLPLSYNMCGIMVIVPADQVEPIELDSKDAMTFVFSGGIVKSKKED